MSTNLEHHAQSVNTLLVLLRTAPTWLNISAKHCDLLRTLLVQYGLEAHILGLQNVELQFLFAAL